jgi:predicted solute-binding protein
MSDEVMEAHIGLYVNEFTYDLGSEGEAAVDYFLTVVNNGAIHG